jgi:hypothetical protein
MNLEAKWVRCDDAEVPPLKMVWVPMDQDTRSRPEIQPSFVDQAPLPLAA